MANLTERDREIIGMAWRCFKEQPQVDYKQLAQMGGYKTPASATACYLAVKKKVTADPTTPLTENDRKLLGMALSCVKAMPSVDYNKLKEMGGYKTAASATACYLTARKKFLAGANADGSVGVKTPTPKKRKLAGATDEGDEKPKKANKKGGSKKTVKSEDTIDDDFKDEDDHAETQARTPIENYGWLSDYVTADAGEDGKDDTKPVKQEFDDEQSATNHRISPAMNGHNHEGESAKS